MSRRTSVTAFVAAVSILGTAVVALGGAASAASSVPSAPRNINAVPGNRVAVVHWLAPFSQGTSPLTGYIVSAYRGSQPVRSMTVGNVHAVNMTGLSNGKTYSFRVSARNANGRGKPAVGPSITVGTPTAPTRVMVSRAIRSADLHWKAPSTNNGSPITSYVVVPYLDGHSQPTRSYAITGTKVTVGGLAVGRSYQFQISARNKNGVGPRSAPTNVVNPPGKIGPDAPPPANGYFPTLAPSAKLPSEASCDARVHFSPWEPRARNRPANHRTPKRPLVVRHHPDFNSTWNSKYRTRVTGNFTGNTDEIIQWAACKWGISDEMLRAEAVDESDWTMSVESDFENRANGHCTAGDHRNPCPTSFGILQIKWYYNPDGNPKNNSYPMSKNMTAFSLDYTASMLRGCYQGWEYFGAKSRGDLWGCMGAWYSGGWHDAGANAYIERVKHFYATKPWRHW